MHHPGPFAATHKENQRDHYLPAEPAYAQLLVEIKNTFPDTHNTTLKAL